MYTPEKITSLKDNQIFVFGSNESGRHGKGAAKQAMKFGAKYGQAEGLQGRTYGIPTVNASISNGLSAERVKKYVDRFIEFAKKRPDLTFLVPPVGCGLAGRLTYKDVAPMFTEAIQLKNVILPKKFVHIIGAKYER